MAANQLAPADPPTPRRDVFFRFSLRGVLLMFSFAAAWFAWLKVLPHVAVFMVGPTLVFTSTILLVHDRGCSPRRVRRSLLVAFTVSAWIAFYLLSVGPVSAIQTYRVFPEGFMVTAYVPVSWLCYETRLGGPIATYVSDWMVHWGRPDAGWWQSR